MKPLFGDEFLNWIKIKSILSGQNSGPVGVCAIRQMCHLANEPFGECAIWRMYHLATT
jgi:hypothetical protein